jgi:hypothetical protein
MLELRVAGDDRQPFLGCLCDKQPGERVSVMGGRFSAARTCCMLIADGVKRFAESSAGSQVDGVSGNLSLPRLYLIAISQPLAALTFTRLPGLIMTVRA